MVNACCVKCYGRGMIQEKDMIGTFRWVNCATCKGLGATPVDWGSGAHRVAANVSAMRQSGQI